MKTKFKLLVIIAVLILLATSLFGCSKAEDFLVFNLDKEELTVGIISDTQLTANDDGYAKNLRKSLEYFKNRGTDVLIFAGDYSDVATKKASNNFKNIYNSVFSDKKPISVAIMGNHDYWLPDFFKSFEIPIKSKFRKRFTNIFEQEYMATKIINGYTFIALSPTSGSMNGDYDIKYAKKALDFAVEKDANKPIFVVTHHNPTDTIKGSDMDSNDSLNELFKNYPNIVSISGHTHTSVLDEQNIMQKNYTAIGTQSLSYTDFSPGYEKIADSGNIENNPMLMFMKIKGNDVEIERVSVNTGKELKEDMRFKLSFPFDSNTAPYTIERKDKINVPKFSNNASGSIETIGNKKYIQIDSATHEDLVIEYHVEFFNGENIVKFKRNDIFISKLKYYSNFYEGVKYPKMNLLVPEELSSGEYTVKVYAVESFGKSSEPIEFKIRL